MDSVTHELVEEAEAGQPTPALVYRELADRTPLPRRLWTLLRRSALGLLAAAIGVVAVVVPTGVVEATFASIVFLGGPDTAFYALMIAVLLAAPGVALGAVALVLLFFRPTRPVGGGYLIGVGLGAVVAVLGFLLIVVAAWIGDLLFR